MGEFVGLAQKVLVECWERRQSVVVVGGSGLYIRALFEEYTEMSSAPDPVIRAALNEKSLDDLVIELFSADASSRAA